MDNLYLISNLSLYIFTYNGYSTCNPNIPFNSSKFFGFYTNIYLIWTCMSIDEKDFIDVK